MEKIIVCIVLFVVGNVGYYMRAILFGEEGEELKRGFIIMNSIIIVMVILGLTGVIWN